MQSLTRNFSIIAHIDHGKSTLADRFIQICGGLSDREMQAQVLDSMDLERERGITIKAQAVSLDYRSEDGQTYRLNFIDTPGHVDFSYEVSRSLAACEGALLVVDAAQGVEAQSVANCYTAVEQGLEVLPVLNKIDLPQADPERVAQEIEDIIGIEATDAARVSAKTGLGVPGLLERLVQQIPAPAGDPEAPLQALIIDSWFDNFVGVISLVRVVNGRLRRHDRMRVMSTGRTHGANEIGVFTPKRDPVESLSAGGVGYIIAGIKEVDGAPVGDTITLAEAPAAAPLPGFKQVQPRVFAGLFTVSSEDYEDLREALQKLRLNDSALHYEPETSSALGFGFRCGFLGMLHMEIVQERLEREYNLDLITTAPTVIYDHHRVHPGAPGLSRRRHHAVRGTPRRAVQDALRRPAGAAGLRAAAERGGAGFLRPAEVGEPWLRLLRLPARAHAGSGSRAARPAHQYRARGCAVADHPPRGRPTTGP